MARRQNRKGSWAGRLGSPMKSRKDEITQRYLLLLKLDAQNLVDRIKSRRQEFIEIFSLRRTREHFPKIFFSRYDQSTLQDLVHCSSETIIALDQFHKQAEEMSWYLYQTEDMPATLEENIYRMSKRLEKLHVTLNLYLNAELSLDESAPSSQSIPETLATLPVGDESEDLFSDKEDGQHG